MKTTDKIFLVSYAIYYIVSIWRLSYLPPVFAGKAYTVVLIFCLGLLFFKEFFDSKVNVNEFMILTIFLVYGGLVLLIARNKMLIVILLYIFSARNVSFEKIARLTILMSCALLAIIFSLAFGGFIYNETTIDFLTERSRTFMGFRYVLFPSCIVGNISALYLHIIKKVNWMDILAVLAVNTAIYMFTNSRLVFILSVMLAISAAISKTSMKILLHNFMIRKLLVLSCAFSAALSMYATYNFDMTDPYQYIINFVLENRLMENIFSLLTLKGAEYIIQFITLPYLLRVLGPDKYGSIVFAQTIVNYGVLAADYGFNITAPRDIARSRKEELGDNFVAIMGAKSILLCCVLALGAIFIYFLQTDFDKLLLVCVMPALFGNVFFPIWFFQGIQQMRFITIFNLIARSISVICIFTFVNEKTDYYLAALFQSSVSFVAGMISLCVLHKKFPYIFKWPEIKRISDKFRDGWDIFISTLFINLYTNTNIFILGVLTNSAAVGYYAAANKLIEAVKGLMAPVSSAIFPHVTVLFKESRKSAIDFLCKVLRRLGSATFVISLLVLVLAPYLVKIIMGDMYDDSTIILRIMSFLPFIIGLSNIFGIQTMVAFGMQRIFSRILMFSALLNFILVFPMIYMWNGVGLAVTTVIVEVFVTLTMYLTLRKYNIFLR